MGTRISAALLPLYVELYDRTMPHARTGCERIIEQVIPALNAEGIDLYRLQTCRTEPEFENAIRIAEKHGVDVLVTLHLAYSPSLESAGPLSKTKLPVVVLDTTTNYSFAPDVDPETLMYNHGIHGVQDMCNLLNRRGKRFSIAAGHWNNSDVIKRTATLVRSAAVAHRLSTSKAGRIGDPFYGMGDFEVSDTVLKDNAGITAVHSFPRHVAALIPDASDSEVEQEIALDKERFDTRGASDGLHRTSVRASIGIRRWIESEGLNAYALNFLGLDADSGFPVIPFLEAGKAMARGVGYAGEGDILTASLVAALSSQYETTFTEMFCPDWEHNRVFLSHMGEINPSILAGTPALIDKHWDFCPLPDACVFVGAMKPGSGVFVDVAPTAQDQFKLIIAPAEIDDAGSDTFSESIRGWMRPRVEITEFLERYSIDGGTHHAAFAYGAEAADIAQCAVHLGWQPVLID